MTHKTTLGTSVRENKINGGKTISLSMNSIILFRNDIETVEKAMNMALNGGQCSVNNVTMEYNKRSKYIHWFGVGKFKLSELQELIELGKALIVC